MSKPSCYNLPTDVNINAFYLKDERPAKTCCDYTDWRLRFSFVFLIYVNKSIESGTATASK